MKCKKCHKEIENLEVCPYCKCKQIKEKVMKDAKKGISLAEKELNKIPIINNSHFISFLLMGVLVFKLILGSIITDMSFVGYLFRNFITILFFLYFLLLQTNLGKKKFSYLNILVCVLLIIQGILPMFSLFVSFKFYLIFSSLSGFFLAFYFIKNFLEEYVEDLPIFDAFSNKEYFYLILGIRVFSLVLEIPTFLTSHIGFFLLEICSVVIMCLFARYTYLYKKKDKNLFYEIQKEQEIFSKKDALKKTKSILKRYNGYQLFGFFLLILGVLGGIYFGSENATCTEIGIDCGASSFDFSSMLLISFASLLLCISFFWMGRVLKILEKLVGNEEKTPKKVKKSVKNID